jgi:hypothetical protein
MNILRTFGKIGLVLLALLMFVGIYVGVQAGNWWGVFLCTGFLVILAQFYDVFRVQTLREKLPHGSFAPSKKIHVLLFLVLGLGTILGGVMQLWVRSYWGGIGLLVIGLVVLSVAIDGFRGRT